MCIFDIELNVYIKNKVDRDALREKINPEEPPYYTYTEKSARHYAFVLRGLEHEPSVQEIESELRKINFEHIKIYSMKSTKNTESPSRVLYVVTQTPHRVSELNNKHKYLLYTRVTWEKFVNKKGVIQCHRCQAWRHATSNCKLNPTCLKCGKGHFTRECKKSMEKPPKCANCGEAHTANSVECAEYVKAITAKERNLGTLRNQPPRYVPAPPPTYNAWERPHTQQQTEQETLGLTTACNCILCSTL